MKSVGVEYWYDNRLSLGSKYLIKEILGYIEGQEEYWLDQFNDQKQLLESLMFNDDFKESAEELYKHILELKKYGYLVVYKNEIDSRYNLFLYDSVEDIIF